MLFAFFAPTFFWLVVVLAWSYACFTAGYKARGEEDITRFIEKTLRRKPPDDPPSLSRM